MRKMTTAGDQVGSPKKPNSMTKRLLLATLIEGKREGWQDFLPLSIPSTRDG
jgi:hypothetical protein